MNKDRISIAISKQLIQQINAKCRRINRNRSNYIETLLLEDLKKDEPKQEEGAKEFPIKMG